MQSLQLVTKDAAEGEPSPGWPSWAVLLSQWLVGAILVFALGTWLVWWSVYLQRSIAEEEIRLACKRVMPETADRCFDTVIIQRGGARR
jgi:hypothetical protein